MIGDAFGTMPDLFSGQNQFAQNPFSSEQTFGGISPIGPLLQTSLRQEPQASPALPGQQQQDQTGLLALLMALGGHGNAGVGTGTGTQDQGNFNDIGSLAGLAVPGIGSLFYRLFANENSPGQRLVGNIGHHIIDPLANFGGRASVNSQLDRLTNFGFGNSGHLSHVGQPDFGQGPLQKVI